MLIRLEQEAKADLIRRWMDTLPYPLASVLHRSSAERDEAARVVRLLHFFEVSAEFACAVLLSVLRAAPDILATAQPEIARAAPPGRGLFDRADFSLWVNLGRTLAKGIRRISEDAAQRSRLVDAAEPAAELVDRLTDKAVWQVLDRARIIRNQRAHGGVVNRAQVAGWLSTLQGILGAAEREVGRGFDDVDLVRADTGGSGPASIPTIVRSASVDQAMSSRSSSSEPGFPPKASTSPSSAGI
jgi:hypothetical protein